MVWNPTPESRKPAALIALEAAARQLGSLRSAGRNWLVDVKLVLMFVSVPAIASG